MIRMMMMIAQTLMKNYDDDDEEEGKEVNHVTDLDAQEVHAARGGPVLCWWSLHLDSIPYVCCCEFETRDNSDLLRIRALILAQRSQSQRRAVLDPARWPAATAACIVLAQMCYKMPLVCEHTDNVHT